MSDLDLLKKVDIEKVVKKGKGIYEKIKGQYEPKENGKYLAIEVESGETFMAKDGAEAIITAKKKYSDKYFYLVKIGFTSAEAVAKLYFK